MGGAAAPPTMIWIKDQLKKWKKRKNWEIAALKGEGGEWQEPYDEKKGEINPVVYSMFNAMVKAPVAGGKNAGKVMSAARKVNSAAEKVNSAAENVESAAEEELANELELTNKQIAELT